LQRRRPGIAKFLVSQTILNAGDLRRDIDPMPLILRTHRRQEEIEGRPRRIGWDEDDYAVVDGDTVVGRIHRDNLPSGPQ